MIPAGESWQAVGKRKNAIARVTLTPGSGKFYIRKWRKLPIAEGQTVTYVNRDGQEVTEDMVFPTNVDTNKMHVPKTASAGKDPFRYTPMEEYFGRETLRMISNEPFQLTRTEGQFDVYINVQGGGLSGQAGAIRHGISKALLAYETSMATPVAAEGEEEAESKPSFRAVLKRAGMLTRDARVKERKKYGQPGARKRFQYSKR
jgi:small subunit ribosomal protein S9